MMMSAVLLTAAALVFSDTGCEDTFTFFLVAGVIAAANLGFACYIYILQIDTYNDSVDYMMYNTSACFCIVLLIFTVCWGTVGYSAMISGDCEYADSTAYDIAKSVGLLLVFFATFGSACICCSMNRHLQLDTHNGRDRNMGQTNMLESLFICCLQPILMVCACGWVFGPGNNAMRRQEALDEEERTFLKNVICCLPRCLRASCDPEKGCVEGDEDDSEMQSQQQSSRNRYQFHNQPSHSTRAPGAQSMFAQQQPCGSFNAVPPVAHAVPRAMPMGAQSQHQQHYHPTQPQSRPRPRQQQHSDLLPHHQNQSAPKALVFASDQTPPTYSTSAQHAHARPAYAPRTVEPTAPPQDNYAQRHETGNANSTGTTNHNDTDNISSEQMMDVARAGASRVAKGLATGFSNLSKYLDQNEGKDSGERR